ncbi:MAG: SWF/SNF helicase family protein [Prevotella sp.]|nr:SWF/SNF helicase family protein [Prevotella sp.]
MIKHSGAWDASNDRKLEQLEQLLRNTHSTDKVLVFSQYSDTANYIYRQLKKRGFDKIACVTGSHQNPTALVERFSPISNNANVSEENQLRILVSTDVLSEGQNLQDCHVIVNYDLPWAIIRLIQRAGRVDRIGQNEEKIFCYSFFPAEGVENIINLRKRLNDRINQNADIVGSDEIFFEGNEQNLRDMFNEKSGSLDDDDDNDVDLSSQAYQIWKNATDANPKLKKIIPAIPNIAYSTKASDNASTTGVITYARTANDFDVLTWLSPDGEVKSQSQKRILNAMACSADTPAATPIENHHELVGKAMEKINEQNITSVGGILGKRTSIRYRIYNLLNTYSKKNVDIFFTEDKKKQVDIATDEIFRYPLIESTKVALGQMLRSNSATIDDVVDYILELRKSGNFCRVEEDSNTNRDPQIICSMGITDNHNLVK